MKFGGARRRVSTAAAIDASAAASTLHADRNVGSLIVKFPRRHQKNALEHDPEKWKCKVMSGMPLFDALLLLISVVVLAATPWRRLHPFLAIVAVATGFGLTAGFTIAFVGKAFGSGFAQAIYFPRTGDRRRRIRLRPCGKRPAPPAGSPRWRRAGALSARHGLRRCRPDRRPRAQRRRPRSRC